MVMLGCLQPSTAGILCLESLWVEVILEVCLEVAPATVVFTKAFYLQGLRLYEFRFYPSFSIISPPPPLLVLARPGPNDTFTVENERVQIPLILTFIDTEVLNSEPAIMLRVGFITLASFGREC